MNCVSDIACIEFPSRIPCKIDLIEPFTVVDGKQIDAALILELGNTYEFDFTYQVGFPKANQFHVFFYSTPEAVRDVIERKVSPTEHQITPSPAIGVSFTPSEPVEDPTGIVERNGVLQLIMPSMGDENYYAILAMSHP